MSEPNRLTGWSTKPTKADIAMGLPGRRVAALMLAILLGGCAGLIPQVGPPIARPQPRPPAAPTQPPAPVATGATALFAGLAAGPEVASLSLTQADAKGALASFRESCPRVLARSDTSGLTRNADWKGPCEAAARWPIGEAPRFFDTWFETVRVSDGKALVTGYYEPEILGVRTRREGFDVPVYALPPDLVRARPGDAPPNEEGRQPPGRYTADGKFVPYYERGEIYDGALFGKGLEIAWAADPVEMFFLQIQGSGRLIGPDGAVVRIGYAGQNGHEYTGIGRLMQERGLVGPGTAYATSMQGLMKYLRDHPEVGREIMRTNKSFVFFRELNGDGPIGALSVPVRAGSSIAVDPAFVPLGAPVFLRLDRAEANGLWIAQDTGGAIQGANRIDTFWGAGESARVTAGGMSARGEALILLPKGALARIQPR
jgi:membrane-bound lytic murein transglycosylase A